MLFFGKLIFSDSTEGAEKIFRDILPFCTGSNAAFGIALLFIVDPTAYITDILHQT